MTPDIAGWDLEKAVLEHLEAVWVEPDQGIWEVRSEPRQVTYSKVMAWVAFDRAIKSAEAFKLDRPIERRRTARIIIRANVIENVFDPTRGSFVSAYGSHELDASLLLLPSVDFLPPNDPRVLGTIAAVERTLVREGLVIR